MKRIKLLTKNHGVVTIDVAPDTDTQKLTDELTAKYGMFIQVGVTDVEPQTTKP